MTPKPSRRCLFLCGFALLSVCVIVLIVNLQPARITRQKYETIQLGMKIEDVERITGMKRDESVEIPLGEYFWEGIDMNVPSYFFLDDNAGMIICVDEHGVIYGKNFGVRRQTWTDYIPGFDTPVPKSEKPMPPQPNPQELDAEAA